MLVAAHMPWACKSCGARGCLKYVEEEGWDSHSVFQQAKTAHDRLNEDCTAKILMVWVDSETVIIKGVRPTFLP